MVLHGGTGLTEEQFADLIARGCAKVNISTALKIAFVDAHREYLEANPGKHDPPSLLRARPRGGEGRWPSATSASSARRGRPRRSTPRPPERVPALIFDCDGVLADTERDGHRPAFNQAFAEAGLPVALGRGGVRPPAAGSAAARSGSRRCSTTPTPSAERIAALHKRKTAIYKEIVRAGGCPARPGVARIVDEALAAGWTLAVASTSAEESVRAVLEHVVGDGDRGALRRVRRRRRARQEARPGDLPARARRARRRARTTRSSSRTRATGSSPRSAPGCAAS